MSAGEETFVAGEPRGPQDIRVDRRAFLGRMSALAAAVAAGTVPIPAGGGDRREVGRGGPDPSRWLAEARVPGLSRSGSPSHPMDLTAWDLAVLIREGGVRPSEAVEAALERIGRWDTIYRAFNEVVAEGARTRARELERGSVQGPLAGVPLAIKDNFHTAGIRTTANSWIFRELVPEVDAEAVARLAGAGGVVVGKTQMGPLATTRALTPDGEVTTVSAWAPDDPAIDPGGSSTGSATAVAARLASSSIGTQTGGSITVPSLAQGLTGLKPTLGRVSLRGVIPLSYTRDHPGPIARDARDAALLLQVMAGEDPGDPRTLALPPVPDYVLSALPVEERGRPVVRWPTRLGVLPGWADGSDERGRSRRAFLRTMEEAGTRLVEVPLPPDWAELTSRALNDVRLPERSEAFMEHLRDDVRLFGVALSPWINGLLLSGDEYLRGQRARMTLLRRILGDLFRECEVVVQDGHLPFDMVGLPLIAFPVGTRTVRGRELPEGVVLGGLPFGEERLLSVAATWQSATDWHTRRPAEPPEPGRSEVGNGRPSGARGALRLDVEEVARRAE